MNKDAKIYIAGRTGLVGSSLVRGLKRQGFTNIMTRDFPGLNLVSQQETDELFEQERPEYVLLAAARVGGIMANNTYRADFIYDNIQIQNNRFRRFFIGTDEDVNKGFCNSVEIFSGRSIFKPAHGRLTGKRSIQLIARDFQNRVMSQLIGVVGIFIATRNLEYSLLEQINQ